MGNIVLFTPEEVAEKLKMNLLTIYKYIRSGDLPAVKLGRTYRVEIQDLKEFINKHKLIK